MVSGLEIISSLSFCPIHNQGRCMSIDCTAFLGYRPDLGGHRPDMHSSLGIGHWISSMVVSMTTAKKSGEDAFP